jgi:hypothetical protein
LQKEGTGQPRRAPHDPKKFTKYRQQPLANIFDLYGGEKIPFEHFTNEIVKNPAKKTVWPFPQSLAIYLES